MHHNQYHSIIFKEHQVERLKTHISSFLSIINLMEIIYLIKIMPVWGVNISFPTKILFLPLLISRLDTQIQ